MDVKSYDLYYTLKVELSFKRLKWSQVVIWLLIVILIVYSIIKTSDYNNLERYHSNLDRMYKELYAEFDKYKSIRSRNTFYSINGRLKIESRVPMYFSEDLDKVNTGDGVIKVASYFDGLENGDNLQIVYARPFIDGKGGGCEPGYEKRKILNQQIYVCDQPDYFSAGYPKHPSREIEYSIHINSSHEREKVISFDDLRYIVYNGLTFFEFKDINTNYSVNYDKQKQEILDTFRDEKNDLIVSSQVNNYAVTIEHAKPPGGGGGWSVVIKNGGVWERLFVSQDEIYCSLYKSFNLPNGLIGACVDDLF